MQTVASFPIEIAVSGNSVDIADGDATPVLADHTDFGSVRVTGGTLVRTYTITNSGTANLTLGTVTVGGAHAGNFTVTLQPTSSVGVGGSTTFQVTFDPSAAGLRNATLSFSTTDPDENPFNFAIRGRGAVVTVTPTAGRVTTEAGGTDTFTVVLAAPPTTDVTIGVSSTDTTEGTVAPTSLTFTAGNWNTAQTVTVTGVDDGTVDGDIAYSIVTTATSADVVYNGIEVADVSVTNSDDDEADLALTKTDGVTSVAAGNTVIYTITATNGGPAATSATVTDTFPAACGSVTWTCSGSGGGSCTASGSEPLTDVVVLPNSGSVTYTATCPVAVSASGSLTNTATITSANDPNAGNNSATDTDTILPCFSVATPTPANQVVGASAGSGSVTVTVPSGCAWTAGSPVAWVSITSGSAGTGTGTVGYDRVYSD